MPIAAASARPLTERTPSTNGPVPRRQARNESTTARTAAAPMRRARRRAPADRRSGRDAEMGGRSLSTTRYLAAGFESKASKNLLRNELIAQTGASLRGFRPGFQPQPSIAFSTFG